MHVYLIAFSMIALGIISNSSKDHNCPLGHDFEAASVLGMADFNQKVSMELRDRLLGETKIKALKESSFRPCLLDTPAEEGLREVRHWVSTQKFD